MALTPPIKDEALTPEQAEALNAAHAATGVEPDVALRMTVRAPKLTADTAAIRQKYLAVDDDVLDLKTREALAVAVSAANNCKDCVKSHAKKAMDAGWSEDEITALLGVAAECSMLNAYHRHRHLDPSLELPSDSAMSYTLVQDPPIDPKVVEMICVVVSGINGCSFCVGAHSKIARRVGVTDDQLREAVRVGAAMTHFNVYFRVQ